jgi:hypothetical protein
LTPREKRASSAIQDSRRSLFLSTFHVFTCESMIVNQERIVSEHARDVTCSGTTGTPDPAPTTNHTRPSRPSCTPMALLFTVPVASITLTPVLPLQLPPPLRRPAHRFSALQWPALTSRRHLHTHTIDRSLTALASTQTYRESTSVLPHHTRLNKDKQTAKDSVKDCRCCPFHNLPLMRSRLTCRISMGPPSRCEPALEPCTSTIRSTTEYGKVY